MAPVERAAMAHVVGRRSPRVGLGWRFGSGGVARSTITPVLAELESFEVAEPGRSRRAEGGPKSATIADPRASSSAGGVGKPGDSRHPVSDQTTANLLCDDSYSF